MTSIEEGELRFEFPGDWAASKLDESSFYRKQFQKIPESKAVDIIAIDPERIFWLIEVKDYRRHQRTKTIDLADEVALKTRDSLAAIMAARVNSNHDIEKGIAQRASDCGRFRIVLQLEQPAKSSRLFPRAIDPSKVQQRLRQIAKSIDPHPIVAEMARMSNLEWNVSSI